MMVRRREQIRNKGWFEEWLNLSFMEKLISIMWFGMTYMIWMMAEGLDVWYRVIVSVSVFILLTLLCYFRPSQNARFGERSRNNKRKDRF